MATPKMLSDDDRLTLVQEIEQRAAAVGLTPTTVCVMAGLSHATWYNWLRCQTAPQVQNAEAVRAELDRQEKKRRKK